MNRIALGLTCLLATLLVSPAGSTAQTVPQSASAAELDPAGFAREMRRLDATLAGAQHSPEGVPLLLSQLPSTWQVRAAEKSSEISSAPLRTLLAAAGRNAAGREAKVKEARTWLVEMAKQVESYSSDLPSRENARLLAGEILRRPGFTPARPPSALELLRRRINQWLIRMLEKFFSTVSRYPMGGEVLFWLVIGAVVLFLAVTLFRYWTRNSRHEGLPQQQPSIVMRTWQEWIRTARQAAERGDFREAIHSAYWAGIVYLEITGIVSPDRARTPREYLRQLEKSSALAAPLEKNRRETLAALTARLERVWYGYRAAGAEDFRECLQQLEGMGCRLE